MLSALEKLKANIGHMPSTTLGIILLVLAFLTEFPGFQQICALSPGAGTIITYISGIAGFLFIVGVGVKKDDTPKVIVFLIACLIGFSMLCVPVHAQEVQKNGIFIGLRVTTDVADTQQAQASGLFRKYIFGSEPDKPGAVYSMTFYDVSNITLKPLNISHAQYNASEAFAVILYKPAPWIALFAMGDGGVAATANVTIGGRFGAGGGADLDLGKRVHALIIPKVTKNSLTGTSFETRIYAGLAF